MFHPLEEVYKGWDNQSPAMVKKVPPELLEPVLGINFARDGIPNKDWLYLVDLHIDAWLLSVTFFFGASFGFDKADRELPRNQSITPKDMASEDQLNRVITYDHVNLSEAKRVRHDRAFVFRMRLCCPVQELLQRLSMQSISSLQIKTEVLHNFVYKNIQNREYLVKRGIQ